MHRQAVIVNFHGERRIARRTMRFIRCAVQQLADQIRLIPYFVLDHADPQTTGIVRSIAADIPGHKIVEVDCGNLGAARCAGIEASDEDLVFFLDGDDFVSFNWFPNAVRFFRDAGAAGEKLIAHTEFFVGFDRNQFVRTGIDSREPSFDPLALAADWFFCNNLACHRSVFEAVAIEPYDHAGGFGAEDWHWSCQTIAKGYAHALVPDTSYFYRLKPHEFSLGHTADLIPKKSELFEAKGIGRLPQEYVAGPVSLRPLDETFFAEADRLVDFDHGLSFLRSVRTGTKTLNYFRPKIPAIVGQTLRRFSTTRDRRDTVDLVFADLARVPGGRQTLDNIAVRLTAGEEPAPKFYIFEGMPADGRPADGEHCVYLDELRQAACSEAQIARVIARFFIQTPRVRVFNFVSPRRQSLASNFAAAKRHTLASWYNIVLEYGLDCFSHTVGALRETIRLGLPARTLCLFRKTAHEIADVLGVPVYTAPDLETQYAFGAWQTPLKAICCEPVLPSQAPIESTAEPRLESPMLNLLEDGWIAGRPEDCGADLSSSYVYLAFGPVRTAHLADDRLRSGCQRQAALLLPALVLIPAEESNSYFRPDPERIERSIRSGSIPSDLFDCGLVAIRSEIVRLAGEQDGIDGRFRLSDLLRALRSIRTGGEPLVGTISPLSVVTMEMQQMRSLPKAALLGSLDGLNPDSPDRQRLAP